MVNLSTELLLHNFSLERVFGWHMPGISDGASLPQVPCPFPQADPGQCCPLIRSHIINGSLSSLFSIYPALALVFQFSSPFPPESHEGTSLPWRAFSPCPSHIIQINISSPQLSRSPP